MTETAANRFQSELAEATTNLNAAFAAVRKAPLQVVAALIDRDCEQLRQLEDYAVRFRAHLLAVAGWWPDTGGPIPLARSSAVLLETPPDHDRARILTNTTQATAPFIAVLDELVQGNADADFRLEK
jgi:hypothetical protein